MASLVPDTNYSPNTTAASNAYVAAQNRFSESLMDPINFLAKMNSDALAQKEREEEKAIRAEDRAWKLEDRDRVAKERQAADAYYGELAKGVQTKGGIYGDALATEANKYALTPDEILRATLYKNDANAARTAGDSTLADKLAWQARVSEGVTPFMQSGLGEESRVEMYDRINSMVGSQGLPIPKEAILSADQARLAEKTAEENAAKELKESKADILKSDQANAWKLVNALGTTRTEIDEDGNEVQVVGSSGRTGSSKDNSKDLAQGLASISEGIKKSGIDSKHTKTATDDALKSYEILVARGLNPKYAGELVADAIGSKETGVLFWKDNVPTIDQNNLLKYADSAIRMNERAGVGAGTTGSGVSTKAAEAAMLSKALGEQSRQSLQSILSEQANLAKGAEGRRADSVNAWLQDRGLIDKPKAVVENAEPALGATGKPLEARVNKNIKSIAGIPDSMVASEGVTNTSYKDGKGYSIAMGYNLHYNKDDITKDFEDANISPEKAFIAKTRPQDLVLDDGEAQRLSQVAYYKYADNLDKELGGNLDKLSPQMQATALQMHYRGDLFKDANYAKELRKYVKADDYDGLVKYVSENADTLPAHVVRRLENDLGAPVTSNLRGTMSDDDKIAYLDKALSGNPKAKEVLEGSEQSNSKGLSIGETVKASELGASKDIKKELDMLNASLQKYKNIEDVPKSELDALKSLSENYSLALKKERINRDSAEPFYKNFNLGRKSVASEDVKHNISDEEKALRALKENPNAATEDIGLVDMSATFIPMGRLPAVFKNTKSTTDDFLSQALSGKSGIVKNSVKNGKNLDVDTNMLQSIFGKQPSPIVQGVTRPSGLAKSDIVEEMIKIRDLKNPTKYDLQELQRLNALLGRVTKKTSTPKTEL